MLPEAFLDRMRRLLGGEYEAFLESYGAQRAQGLCLNPVKIGADGRSAAERLGCGADGDDPGVGRLSRVPWAENGYYYGPSDQPGKHPYHEAGLYYIQEPSAMAPVELLGVQPGERVLDLCAAPGGKSAQIGGKLRGLGFLLCNEIHPARAKVLSENMERMGIRNACVANETPQRLAERFPGYFDRILVDAPCSGEGMFRKKEGACEEWSPENVRLCAERQDGILDCAARLLRPGGRLVYSTCTFAPEEDEGTVGRFLGRHGDFGIRPIEKAQLGLEGCDGIPGWAEDSAQGLEHALRLWPHRINGEGHFAAVLQRHGDMPERGRFYATNNTAERVPEEMVKAFRAFCGENLHVLEGSAGSLAAKAPGSEGWAEDGSRYLAFGDHLYLAPPDQPALKGLKVLRPGLHLGQMKKDRFEPSHALALALAPADAAHVWDLAAEDAAAYLNGQTFPAGGEKGWYLICVDGFSMGWGKLAGGVMKNHYPKGLRLKGRL